MKKFIRTISAISFMLVLLFVMTSCSGYSFYNDFHNAGSTIEKDHIFEVITLEEAKAKKENGDTFVLLYGSSQNSACVSVVSSLQIQSEYLGNKDIKIYYLNSKDYDTTSKVREVKEAINMYNPSKDGSPIIMTFISAPVASRVDIDTSDTDKVKTKKFIKDGTVQYASIASYIFHELFN